jgi:large subunit ribosomal protein L1
MAETKPIKKVVGKVSKSTTVKKTAAKPKPAVNTNITPVMAKAGKRSAKSLKAAKEKIAKQVRKQTTSEDEKITKPAKIIKKTRTRFERKGKRYRQLAVQIEKGKIYSLLPAIELATKTNPTKFDATVEMHIRLNVDPKHADQNIRDSISLPAGTGKNIRIAVYADSDVAVSAKQAGADIAGLTEVTELIEKNKLNFDILISSPNLMPQLGKYAKILGPKGLMPNPKSGTVTNDVAKAVREAKAGRVEYRADSAGIVHVGIGKVSFGPQKLQQNAEALLNNIKSNRPASVKSTFIQSVYITTSMGPAIPINPNES